jgi:hypothetical protein
MNLALYKTQPTQGKAASTLNSRTLYLHMLKRAMGEAGGQGCDLHDWTDLAPKVTAMCYLQPCVQRTDGS